MSEQSTEMTLKSRISEVRNMHMVQGIHHQHASTPYMLGLYNGLELAMAILDDRPAVLKEAAQ